MAAIGGEESAKSAGVVLWAASLLGLRRCCVAPAVQDGDAAADPPWNHQVEEKEGETLLANSESTAAKRSHSAGAPLSGGNEEQKRQTSPGRKNAEPVVVATISTPEISPSQEQALAGEGRQPAAVAHAGATTPSVKPPKKTASASTTSAASPEKPLRQDNIDVPAERSTPSQKLAGKKPKKSYLQMIKEEKRQQEAKVKEMGQLVDDILAGKYQGEASGNGQPQGNMLIRMPSPYERTNTRKMLLEQYGAHYRKLGKSECGAQAAEQYSPQQTQALTISRGHQAMPRPKGIKVPKDFRKPVGEIDLKTLHTYGSTSSRMLVSVYGDIFDVSDRPDKYAADGPYAWMAGHDLTWGFVSGKDTEDQVDQLYDMWKIAPDEFRDRKLSGLMAWVAFYEYEYGGSIGKLKEYVKEVGLKGPPMEKALEECSIM